MASAHLDVVHQPVRVAEDLAWWLQASCHEERWPIDGMEPTQQLALDIHHNPHTMIRETMVESQIG